MRVEALVDRRASRKDSDGPSNQVQVRLAVLIPVLNDQRGLDKSLASLALDGSHFVVFVVDDGSDPPLRLPLDLPYGVRLLRQDGNREIVAALNTGLEAIVGGGYHDYVARLDAGDLGLAGRFPAQMAFLDDHPGHAVIGTAINYVDPDGRFLFDFHPPTDHGAIMRMLRYRAALAHPSIMIRLQALLSAGFYRDTFLTARITSCTCVSRTPGSWPISPLPSWSWMSAQNSLSWNWQRNLISRLNLLTSYFDPRSVHAYLGIAANLLLLLVPRPLMLRFRRWVGMLRGAKPVAAAAQRRRHALAGSDFGRRFLQGEDKHQNDPVKGCRKR